MSEEHNISVGIDGPYAVDDSAIMQAAAQALAITQSAPVGLSVSIASEDKVRELNLQYAGIDSSTDVLSFPAEGEPYRVEPGEPPYLGDIIIAYPIAEQQALDAHLPVSVELQLLTIHGTLHLLGYDHDTPEKQAEMWAYQSAAMDAVRAANG